MRKYKVKQPKRPGQDIRQQFYDYVEYCRNKIRDHILTEMHKIESQSDAEVGHVRSGASGKSGTKKRKATANTQNKAKKTKK